MLALAGLPPSCAAAVEDTGSGVEAAKKAGIFCYGCKNSTSGEQNIRAADEVIEHLRSIIA